ncbi:hypothetical protein BJX70DRAFT_220689 [Aspergillus crustosus]
MGGHLSTIWPPTALGLHRDGTAGAKHGFRRLFSPILESRERITPVAFTPRFRRALTLPTPVKPRRVLGFRATGETETEMQAQSPFFMLPAEIRRMVYLEVLRFPGIHIYSYNGVVGASVCSERYSESIPFLYEENVFSMNQDALNVLPRIILPKRLACIQHLRVYVSIYHRRDRVKWKRVGSVLKRLSGLRSLCVSLGPLPTSNEISDGANIVQPLLSLSIPDFVLELPTGPPLQGLVQDLLESQPPFRVVLAPSWYMSG